MDMAPNCMLPPECVPLSVLLVEENTWVFSIYAIAPRFTWTALRNSLS